MNPDIEKPQPDATDVKPRRRFVKRAAWALLVVCVVVVALTAYVVKDHVRTLASLRRVPGTKMYVMDYYGAYNMEKIRAGGVDPDDVEGSLIRTFFPDLVVPIADRFNGQRPDERRWHEWEHSCSTVAARGEDGEVLFGRNFDWRHDACLVVKIHGGDNTSSVAVLDLKYLNLDEQKLADPSFVDRARLLFAPYLAFDGMNEHGVAVSIMSADGSQAPFDDSKPTVLLPVLLRLTLDYARDTDEALELFRQYNVDFDRAPCHIMIADAESNSVVVEFIDGRMNVVAAAEDWQVSTNHLLHGRSETDNDAACYRYCLASDRIAADVRQLDTAGMMGVMSSISVEDWTMWTSVYNLTTREFQVAYRRQFDQTYEDQLLAD